MDHSESNNMILFNYIIKSKGSKLIEFKNNGYYDDLQKKNDCQEKKNYETQYRDNPMLKDKIERKRDKKVT
jgi:hypothetical protein